LAGSAKPSEKKVVKAKQDGNSFLLLQNCLTRGENVKLKQQLLRAEVDQVNLETNAAVMQLAQESGIKIEDFDKYQFNLQGLAFILKEDSPAKKKTTKKKAVKRKAPPG
jgi:hypothetical protein